MNRIVNTLLRSALRLSQPLSGFSMLNTCGLVSCHCRPWGSSFRAFPSQRSRAPLEAAGSLVVIPELLGCALSCFISVGFLAGRAAQAQLIVTFPQRL